MQATRCCSAASGRSCWPAATTTRAS
jgi:hypothetical protein